MTYQLLLTTLGQQKMATAASNGGAPISISEFAVGQGIDVDFAKRLDQQVLVSKRYQAAVESVTATNVAGQYEVVCIVPQAAGGWAIREIGLIDSAGDLIWVGQVPEVHKPAASSTAAVDYRIKAVISIDNPDVVMVIDANVVTATQAWVANNFVSNPRFAQFLDLAYPYGHKYWTHSKSNPKPLFDAMFGFETHWRRLEGVSLVAVKDGDAFLGQPMLTLGQRGTTELAMTERPHAYPVYTSYLFERYNPDDVVETVWQVSANKTSISEGAAVRFTVTANNLPDGQILDWAVKEGTLSADSNNIDAPEKSESGTVILKNGQAVIDFVTTPDDNNDEPQKHVRLTVGAPANLSLNVPIADTGHHETVLHISQSTTDGISLDEYYYTQYGAYPAVTDTVRFIVDDGVDVIAPDTTTPAMTEGAHWPTGNTPVIENHGRILGRGGDAGSTARFSQKKTVNLTQGAADYNEYNQLMYDLTKPAIDGQSGGTAIKGIIKVENYGLIGGGGGGGGGGGIYYARSQSGESILIDGIKEHLFIGGGGGAGGGAPFGRRAANLHTVSELLENFEFVSLPAPTANSYVTHVWMKSDETSHYQLAGETPTQVDLPNLVCVDADVSFFRHERWTDDNKRFFFWGSNSDAVFLQSQAASIDMYGTHGYSPANGHDRLTIQNGFRVIPTSSISQNHGGDGGAIGEFGKDGVIGNYYDFYGSVSTDDIVKIVPPAKGGLAGYISQGNVTINNYGSGTTKGRTAN